MSVTFTGSLASFLTGGTGSVTVAVISMAILASLPILLNEDLTDPAGVGQLVRNHNDLHYKYDFIVIGGGSAGCAIAARLSEAPHVTVLLLEAGGIGNPVSNVPFLTASLIDEDIGWKYKTKPDGRSCLGLEGQSCKWHRGRVLGGSSVINGMLYVRGNKEDFNEWERRGNYGWGYEDVLPYFKKSENQDDPHLASNSRYHGRGGPQPISFPRYKTNVAWAFLESGGQHGYNVHKDLNGPEQEGFSFMQVNMRRGSRYSSARSFLGDLQRKNLHIALNAHVTKIDVDYNKKATGVYFEDENGHFRRISAAKEVVLSAGTIASPQILMLSGIGPKYELNKFDIPVKADLPVGRNMQSHVGTGELIFSVEKPGLAFDGMSIVNPSTYLSYFKDRRGPLTSANQFEGLAFIKTGLGNMSWPDVELQLVASHIAADGGLAVRNHLGISRKMFDGISDQMAFKEGFTIIPYLLHPKSRGRIRLRSRDVKIPPVIESNYFTHPYDVKTMIKAIRFSLSLVQRGKTFRRHGAKLIKRKNPFCLKFKFNSDAYWECVIRHNTQTVYHDVGSCGMGSVVDPELRVFGVKNLRVADASVFPTHTSGNTNTPTVMIAEKAADLIKRDWYL